jgi:hypothetical protein
VKLWSITFKYQNRKTGPAHHTLREKGSLPVALARATRAFYKERTTKDRYDIKRAGLRTEIYFLRNVEKDEVVSGAATHGE